MKADERRAKQLDTIAHLGTLSADQAILNPYKPDRTRADETRVAVWAALDRLEAQGFITFASLPTLRRLRQAGYHI
jgi:hypothetical protein